MPEMDVFELLEAPVLLAVTGLIGLVNGPVNHRGSGPRWLDEERRDE